MDGISIPEISLGADKNWSGTTIRYSFGSDFPSYYTDSDKALVGNAGH